MARRPYTTKARLLAGSDQQFDLVWYPALASAGVLPFPSKVNSLDWSTHPWLAAGIGEVFGATRNYNGKTALSYATGLTPCGDPLWFLEGEPLGLSLPPAGYNPDGFACCCLPGGGFSPVNPCLTATPMMNGDTFSFLLPTSGSWWLNFPPPHFPTMFLITNEAMRPFCRVRFYRGADCDSLVPIGTFNPPLPAAMSIGTLGFLNIWAEIDRLGGPACGLVAEVRWDDVI